MSGGGRHYCCHDTGFNFVFFYLYSHASLNDKNTSEELVISPCCYCGNIRDLHKPRWCSLPYTCAAWYSLLLLVYTVAQHATVLNTVGNCNAMVFVYLNISNLEKVQ